MGTVLTDKARVGCYIVSEAGGATGGMRSREKGVLLTGAVYEPGMVLGRLTANDKYVPLAAEAADPATGSHVPAAICFGHYDGSDGDVEGVVSKRETEANGHELIWPEGYAANDITAAESALREQGIVVRY